MIKKYAILFIVYSAIMYGFYRFIMGEVANVALVKSLIAGVFFVIIYVAIMRWNTKRNPPPPPEN